MLKFLLSGAVVMSITGLSVVANGTSEELSIFVVGSSFEPKIQSIANCVPTDISVHYSEEAYIETHSASYLEIAVKTAQTCDNPKARIIGLKYASSTPEENALTSSRMKEAAAYLEAYNVGYSNDSSLKKVPVNSAILNGLTVKIEFNYDDKSI